MRQVPVSEDALPRSARNWQRLTAAAVAGAGGIAAWLAWQLPVGSWDRMGPGFLPVCTALALAVVALAGTGSRAATHPCAEGSPVPLLLAATGVSGFALLVEPAGGMAAAVFLASMAALAAGLAPLRALAAGCLIGAGSLLLFIHGLDVPIRPWPAVTGR